MLLKPNEGGGLPDLMRYNMVIIKEMKRYRRNYI